MSTDTDHTTEPRTGCTVEEDGRITFGLRLPSAAPGTRLLLRLRPRKGQPETTRHLLTLEAGEAGRAGAGGHAGEAGNAGEAGHYTAVLPVGTVLAEGRWDVCLTDGPDDDHRRLRPGLRDLRALVDGHTRDRSAPVAVRIPYVTKDGFLAIRSWLRAAHAETARVRAADGTLTVTARLHGTEFGKGAAVRLRLRGTRTERLLTPQVADDRRDFSFAVGLDDLVTEAEAEAGTEAGAAAAQRFWDLSVRPAEAAPPVRVARLLDDVADRKHIHVQPAARVGDTVVRPYYTVDNDLSVTVTPAG